MRFSNRIMMVIAFLAIAAVIITTLVSTNIVAIAGPVFATGKIIVIRVGSDSAMSPALRATFINVSSAVIDNNPKLKEAIAGADSVYETNLKTGSSGQLHIAGDPAFEVPVSEQEANALISALSSAAPLKEDQYVNNGAVAQYHNLNMQYNDHLYGLTLVTVGQ